MTEEQWRRVDDTFIAEMDALDSRTLVKLLWERDEKAWKYVHARAVLPMLKRASLGRMAYDGNRSDLDVCAAVFEYLIGRRKLDLYRHSCPLVYWIRFWVMKDILECCKKNSRFVSDEGLENVLITENTPSDVLAFNDEVNWCYMKLHGENKTEAKVLYLKSVERRSSGEVMRLLGLSSEANVDQMYCRARKKMREYLEESRKINSGAACRGRSGGREALA